MSAWPTRVAVVGAGTMGIGIAHVFAAAGIDTVLVDATPDRSREALARAVALLPETEPHLSAAETTAAAVDGADLVVEAVVERPDVKQAVYAEIEAAAAEDAVIATNTSSIPLSELAAGLARAERFLGVHWFVPPRLVPCVEVIAAATTDEQVVARVVEALRRLGKAAVVVGDGPGFVANRIQFAMFREAAQIVEEGLATAEQVDEVVRSSFGFRLPFFGPFTIADLAGLDVYADIFATLERGLGAGFAAPAILRDHVERGELGVKSGRGFLALSETEAEELIERRDRAYVALAVLRRVVEA